MFLLCYFCCSSCRRPTGFALLTGFQTCAHPISALGYLLLYRRYSLSWLLPWLVGFVFVIAMMDVLWLHEPVAPLTESLNSSQWLVIHVVSAVLATGRSEEHTSELQSLMSISYAVFCLKTKNITTLANTKH